MTLNKDYITVLYHILEEIYNRKDNNKKIPSYKIPYYEDLEKDTKYNIIFKDRDSKFKDEVDEYINNIFLIEKLKNQKTNGDKMIYRIYYNNKDDFMEFRKLNRYKKNIKTKRFEELNKKFTNLFFNAASNLGNIDKYNIVLDSFHNKIHGIFPLISY